MITIKNVKTQSGALTDIQVSSLNVQTFDAKALLLNIPALVDLDECLRAPLETTSDDLKIWSKAIVESGITSVFLQAIAPSKAKSFREYIDPILKNLNSPLNLYFFADGTNPDNFNDIGKFKAFYKGIKTTVDLSKIPLPPYGNALERVFQIAAQEDLAIVIDLLQYGLSASEERKTAFHAVEISIKLTEKYNGQLCLKNVRTENEIDLIQKAKEGNLLVYADVSCPHLFISEDNVSQTNLGNKHFLPTAVDQKSLWEAMNHGVIDMISSGGSLFAQDAQQSAFKLWLPALLAAYQEKRLLLDTLVALTSVNAQNIFRLPFNEDSLLVDMNISTSMKMGPSPYPARSLTGWVNYVIANGELFTVS